MKNILILAMVFLLILANVSAEIVTTGSVISIKGEQDTTSSLDIKDVIKASLLRPYGSNEFEIDVSKLPSVNDDEYVLTQISDKSIVITPDKFEVDGKGIRFINGNAFVMPLTKYTLAKNLRIFGTGSNDILKVQDSKLSFRTHKITIKDGIVYAGEKELPLKIMPNMILNDLMVMFREENFKKMEILANDDEVTYNYVFKKSAKLFFWNTIMDVSIVVDATTGAYSIKKPFYSVFFYGENAGIKDYDFNKYAAF